MRKIAIFSQLGSKLEAQEAPNRVQNLKRLMLKNVAFFNIDFLGIRPQLRSILDLQLGAKLAILASKD